MKIKRYLIGACAVVALAGCGNPGGLDQQMNEAAATVASRMGEAFPSTVAIDPTTEALAAEAQATIEAAVNDPTVQAGANEALATADALANDPTAQAALATANALANDPTAQAELNDAVATMESAANDPTAQALAATMQAAANDPTAQAQIASAIASFSETDLQAAVDAAFAGMGGTIQAVDGQPLDLEMLSYIGGITSYRMTVVDAPAGAEASEGQVIKEASDGNISLTPEEYEKYFTAAGDYTVRLDLTSGESTATEEFTVAVP